MTIACPNDASHLEFRVSVRVTEEWLVDERGEFVRMFSEEREAIKRPDPDSDYQCIACGAWAEVAR